MVRLHGHFLSLPCHFTSLVGFNPAPGCAIATVASIYSSSEANSLHSSMAPSHMTRADSGSSSSSRSPLQSCSPHLEDLEHLTEDGILRFGPALNGVSSSNKSCSHSFSHSLMRSRERVASELSSNSSISSETLPREKSSTLPDSMANGSSRLANLYVHSDSSKQIRFESASVQEGGSVLIDEEASLVELSAESSAEYAIPEDLDLARMPHHVAIIMDGNSRWAKMRGHPITMGHEAGTRALKEVIKFSKEWGIRVLTVFAFSIENWQRPAKEVKFLMGLFERVLTLEASEFFFKENIRVCFIGDLSKIPMSLRSSILLLQKNTEANQSLKLVIALSYSGREDIVQACRILASEVKDGHINLEDITESALNERMLTLSKCGVGDPDLLIRTSGEKRISNFLLWQMAYTEFVFVDVFWPDFGRKEYKEALLSYQNRERRFGHHPW